MEVTFNRDWIFENDLAKLYHPLVESVVLGPEATIFRGNYRGNAILDNNLPRFFGSLEYAVIYASSREFPDHTRYIYGYLQRFYPDTKNFPKGLRLLVLNAQNSLAIIDEWIAAKEYRHAAYLIIAYGYFRFPQIRAIAEGLWPEREDNKIQTLLTQLTKVYNAHIAKAHLQGRVPNETAPQYNGRTSFTGDIAQREYDHDVALALRDYCRDHGNRYQGYLAWMLADLQPKWTAEWPDPLMQRHINPGFFNHDVVIFAPHRALCANGYDLFRDCQDQSNNYIVPVDELPAVRDKIQASISNRRKREFAAEARTDIIQWPPEEEWLRWLGKFTATNCPLGPRQHCFKELHPSQYSGRPAKNSPYHLQSPPPLHKLNQKVIKGSPRKNGSNSNSKNSGRPKYVPPHQRQGVSKWVGK